MDEHLAGGLTSVMADGTTRRTVVKTGVKLAYAAPLVAASFQLRTASAQEVSPVHPECEGATCASFIPCSTDNLDCVCVTVGGGGGECTPGSTQCADLVDCGPGPDFACPDGSFCAVDTCCGRPVCIPFELSRQCPPAPDGAAPAGKRRSSGRKTVGG